MFNVHGPEALVIFVVALVVLGPEKLPTLARRLGQFSATLRQLVTSFQHEMETAAKYSELKNRTETTTHSSEDSLVEETSQQVRGGKGDSSQVRGIVEGSSHEGGAADDSG